MKKDEVLQGLLFHPETVKFRTKTIPSCCRQTQTSNIKYFFKPVGGEQMQSELQGLILIIVICVKFNQPLVFFPDVLKELKDILEAA